MTIVLAHKLHEPYQLQACAHQCQVYASQSARPIAYGRQGSSLVVHANSHDGYKSQRAGYVHPLTVQPVIPRFGMRPLWPVAIILVLFVLLVMVLQYRPTRLRAVR